VRSVEKKQFSGKRLGGRISLSAVHVALENLP
jgi:hypothetical protein